MQYSLALLRPDSLHDNAVLTRDHSSMGKAEIPKLTKEERDELRLVLAELDADGWDDIDDPLSPAEKALLDQRFAELEKNSGASIPWQSAVDRLRERFPG